MVTEGSGKSVVRFRWALGGVAGSVAVFAIGPVALTFLEGDIGPITCRQSFERFHSDDTVVPAGFPGPLG